MMGFVGESQKQGLKRLNEKCMPIADEWKHEICWTIKVNGKLMNKLESKF